jgi:hypothetical protein
MSWVNEAIERLLISSDGEINSRLEKISIEFEIEKTKAIGHCYCIKLDANGNVRWKDLVDFMIEQIIDYTIPRKEIIEAKEYFIRTGSTSKIVRLKEKASNLFANIKKTGEGGEMLLYILTKEFLKLPQLISKMSLKTSGNVHYHGVDGIHVKYDNVSNSLVLYWGESKMYSNISTALKDCFKSLKGFLLDTLGAQSVQERDLELITANLNANVMDDNLEKLLVRYFDKDDDLSNNIKYKGICFVGFDCKQYPDKPLSKKIDEVKKEITNELASWKKTVSSKILEHPNLDLFEISVFLIPFPSVKEFRDYFLKTLAK